MIKNTLVSIGFIFFATIIIIVLTVQQIHGVNLLEGISWPRFTTTRQKSDEEDDSSEEADISKDKHKQKSTKKDSKRTKKDSKKEKKNVNKRKRSKDRQKEHPYIWIITERCVPEHNLERPKTYKGIRSKFEAMGYRAIESMFLQVGFRTVRPIFNMGRKGRPLEYDAYSHCLRLAIEFDGRQHAEFVEKFHGTILKFYEQQDRDKLKLKNSLKAGITQLNIPHTCKTEDDVIDHINAAFEEMELCELMFHCEEGCTHDVEYRGEVLDC